MGQTLHLGDPTVVEAFADRTPFGAVFEDDGKVAYFYGLDTRLGANPVVDSVCLYAVEPRSTPDERSARRAGPMRRGARMVGRPTPRGACS